MTIKVHELMTSPVVTTQPHKSIAHVREILETNHIGAVAVIDTEGHPVGIASATDLAADLPGGAPVSSIMSEKVYTVPQYEEVSVAARVMRNHRIHRVVVTHEHAVIGMLSAFDLLRLVEDHRFVMKNAPTPSRRKAARRA
ncbi:MAG: CBS domain-containing protein [Gammaproteobacteria bacterium]